MRFSRPALLVVAAGLVLAACGSTRYDDPVGPSVPAAPVPSSFAPVTVTLLAHDSFALSKTLLEEFTARSGITVQVVTGGDAGQLVNKAALTAGNPEGDVLFGVDSTLLSRALTAGVFDPYVSPKAATVPSALKAATKDAVTPVDYGDVCVNVDTAWFAKKGLPAPATLEQLADPTYKDLLVVENPETSSPGLAFLLATVDRFGEQRWADYWKALRANGVKVVDGWTQAYEDEYSGAGKGSRPLVVSYASSPPAEVVYAADPATAKPTSSVLTDGCYRQVEYAGVLAGAKHPVEARAVVDWLLSPEVQADVPLSMFVFPAVPGTPLPKVFTDYAATPKQPLALDPALVDEKRAEWLDTWDQVTLR
jgi:thiamine transport system substrate-binding protein